MIFIFLYLEFFHELLGNGLATYLLQKGASKNLNLKSAWLHSLQDALFSLGVMVSAGIIYFTGWNWLDPIASILISIFLLKEIFSVLSEAIEMMMDSVPKDLDFNEVKNKLLAMSGVVEIKDLHIWQTGSDNLLLSAHLETTELNPKERVELIAAAQAFLKEQYHISHVTLQIISTEETKMVDLNCEHCN